ncbi:MAG: hypothetical protein HUJ90_05815, partial [Bacteroidales bacterium]|nr:hypothetical protein [Bacteroidales bacterium]
MKKILLASRASGALILAICRSRANRMKPFPNSLTASLLVAVAMFVPQMLNASEEPVNNYVNGFSTLCQGFEPASLASDDCYAIGNADQLYWFAEQVNGGQYGLNARLTADIVVNQDVLDANGELIGAGAGFRVWTPIGLDEDGKKYEGTFDGQGHTISGLYINDGNEDNKVIGLFCALGSAGIVKNVAVIDSYFYANSYSAGICGSN